jgi:hypothetical protein
MGRSPRSRLADVRISATGLMRSLYYLEKEWFHAAHALLFPSSQRSRGATLRGGEQPDLQNLDSLRILRRPPRASAKSYVRYKGPSQGSGVGEWSEARKRAFTENGRRGSHGTVRGDAPG